MNKENWLDALNDDVRDIRGLTLAIYNEVEQMKIQNRLLAEDVKESKRSSDSSSRKAEAAWELVIITREQVKEEVLYLKKPLWKKWLGIN